MALSNGVQKDIAMCKMQCALQKRIHPMYFQGYARFAEILSELTKTWSSGATEYRV